MSGISTLPPAPHACCSSVCYSAWFQACNVALSGKETSSQDAPQHHVDRLRVSSRSELQLMTAHYWWTVYLILSAKGRCFHLFNQQSMVFCRLRCGFCWGGMKTCTHAGPFWIRSDTSDLKTPRALSSAGYWIKVWWMKQVIVYLFRHAPFGIYLFFFQFISLFMFSDVS